MSQRQSIHALELGGTLFVPASHKHLAAILSGEKYPALRSVVIDFEDGLADVDRTDALNSLSSLLGAIKENKLLRFIRPQGPEMLETFLEQKHIEKIDGFILPKFGLGNADAYLSAIQNPKLGMGHYFMPSLEGAELFDVQKLQQLREILLPYQNRVICIRFGAEDMLRQLGLRRPQNTSLYDMLAPAQVIANLITTFKPSGFNISAPVFPDFSDTQGFEKEVQRELENGLISKTVIHPSQIEPMNRLCKVTEKELLEAQVLLSKKDGTVNLAGKMGEVKTQSPWAKTVVKREQLYGKV